MIEEIHRIEFINGNVSKPELQISIDGHSVDETNHTKFLGVIIDSKLNWKNHILYITGKMPEGFVLLQKLESCSVKNSNISVLHIRLSIYVVLESRG